MSKRGIGGTYEIEVLLGSQQVCLLEVDLPETKSELRTVKVDTQAGQELLRGLLAGVYSERGQENYTRQLQVYDLLEGISTLREAIEAGESNEKLKAKLTSSSQDEVAAGSTQYFFFLADQLNREKLQQLLSQFSKFLLNKKESLPKVNSQPKSTTPRWDRVVKQTVLITDEPTQEIEVNPLEEGISEEADTTETEWHEETPEEVEPEDIPDTEEIP